VTVRTVCECAREHSYFRFVVNVFFWVLLAEFMDISVFIICLFIYFVWCTSIFTNIQIRNFALMLSGRFINSGNMLTFKGRIGRFLIAFYSSWNVRLILECDWFADLGVVSYGNVLG
jgi:hypothetical protein